MEDGLLPGQFPVSDTMRLIGVFAQALLPIRFVVAVVAFEPDDLAVAFEGQDVGGEPVEEPAVVAADDGAAGEILQPFFQCAQGIHVQIVGRLVEDDEIRALFQHARQMHPIAFAAGEVLHLLLLIRPGEVEAGTVAAGIDCRSCRA